MRVRGRPLAALAAALALPLAAEAADDPAARGFDPDPHRLAIGLDPGFMVESAAVRMKGSWQLGLELQWLHGLLAWKQGGAKVGDVLPDRLQADLLAAWSLGFLELGAALPVVLHQTSDFGPLTSRGVTGPLVAPVSRTSLGDLRLLGKLRLLSQEGFPIDLAGLLELRAPTGSGDSFAGEGLAAVPGLAAGRRLGKLRLDLGLRYVIRDQGQYLQLVVHDAFAWGLAASWDLPRLGPLQTWRAIAEVTGEVPRGSDPDSARYRAPLSARLGARARLFGNLSADLGFGTGLGEAGYGREGWRAFLGLRWENLRADRDGDGVPDDADRCPDVPGPVALQGCPDGDRDGDGVKDSEDRCPDQKGPPELDGCPDRDGDEIPDVDDRCPDQPGPGQNDGCPGEAVVEIETERLSLKDAINFDTGKDTIKKESFRILDEIASVLKAHPEVKRVRVEGHTDNVGGASYNMDLSNRRAQSVVRYLSQKGIARERLAPRGYGYSRPVASNATALGRAKNRRVEFTILAEGEAEDVEKGRK